MQLIECTVVLGNVGEFVGAVAVLATLFYLARQCFKHFRTASMRSSASVIPAH